MWTAASTRCATVTTINYELIFADMETVQKRLDKAVKMQKDGRQEMEARGRGVRGGPRGA